MQCEVSIAFPLKMIVVSFIGWWIEHYYRKQTTGSEQDVPYADRIILADANILKCYQRCWQTVGITIHHLVFGPLENYIDNRPKKNNCGKCIFGNDHLCMCNVCVRARCSNVR